MAKVTKTGFRETEVSREEDSKEPASLRSGKAFHNLVERFYKFESDFEREKTLFKVTSRTGRMDLFLWFDPREDYAVIVEIKNTDWDRLACRKTVRRNLRSHINQVRSSLEGSLKVKPISDETGHGNGLDESKRKLEQVERSAGIVYPRTPNTPGLKEEIEEELRQWGISAVWFDEPPPQDSPAWRAWRAMQEGTL